MSVNLDSIIAKMLTLLESGISLLGQLQNRGPSRPMVSKSVFFSLRSPISRTTNRSIQCIDYLTMTNPTDLEKSMNNAKENTREPETVGDFVNFLGCVGFESNQFDGIGLNNLLVSLNSSVHY